MPQRTLRRKEIPQFIKNKFATKNNGSFDKVLLSLRFKLQESCVTLHTGT